MRVAIRFFHKHGLQLMEEREFKTTKHQHLHSWTVRLEVPTVGLEIPATRGPKVGIRFRDSLPVFHRIHGTGILTSGMG